MGRYNLEDSTSEFYLDLAAKLVIPPIEVLTMMVSSHLDRPPYEEMKHAEKWSEWKMMVIIK